MKTLADPRLRIAAFSDLDAATLYGLLRLRVDVFVVEQRCAYPELDGRDTEPGTRHLWLTGESGEPVAYLRIIEEPGGVRIGRVVTAAHARGAGLAGRLVDAAIETVGDRPVRLHAQVHATGLYERRGFVTEGETFVEDGIPHVPMVRSRPVHGAA
ncbi:GNAT family N-acetyltransferase [Actinomadura sp. HBU206391]|uniref:GNAT family N-acetyltransferase n=1 Tax=Actinomadura sp. HBU206391 TaxID=2731692 RepID=UPI001650C75B|nr:GNAT family N-acetyltransferase [Actinomadura sp. HBU206391]MBC6460027.1 GNAT family N-acetyltransferase [Actinomadura sp. HBU206391]